MMLLSLAGYVSAAERISAVPASSNLPQPLLISGLSALLNRSADFVAPFGPCHVVIAHLIESQQIAEHKPGVTRPLADSAINHRVRARFHATLIEINFRELICGLEGGVIIGCGFPRHAFCAGNVTATQPTFLRVLRHVL